jgi:hypothetical protein
MAFIPVKFSTDEMVSRILFGIELVDTEGNPFPQDLLQSYLDSAVAWAEQILSISILQRPVSDEQHDFVANDYMNWGYIKLWHRPVASVEKLTLWYGNQKMYDIPSAWLKVDQQHGAIQLFPTTGVTSGLIITSGGSLFLPLVQGGFGYAPQMWSVDYTAGMSEPDTNAQGEYVYAQTNIHPNLKEVIYKRASIGIMQVWGDLIIGAGIANMSLSVDGLSQSIGTTQSPMFGGASARIKQMQEDIDNMLPALRSYYGGIDMVVI